MEPAHLQAAGLLILAFLLLTTGGRPERHPRQRGSSAASAYHAGNSGYLGAPRKTLRPWRMLVLCGFGVAMVYYGIHAIHQSNLLFREAPLTVHHRQAASQYSIERTGRVDVLQMAAVDEQMEKSWLQQDASQLARKQLEEVNPKDQSLRHPVRTAIVLKGGTTETEHTFEKVDDEEDEDIRNIPKCIEGSGSGIDFADQVYVLNLERRSYRFEALNTELQQHGICAERWVAVDGSARFEDPKKPYIPQVHPKTGKALQPTDAGYVLTPGLGQDMHALIY
mmetsp:Transcript_12504/g.45590  ORF Transcript_12504/g.45590 Transcript_12504/m.45590 type:complete len:280 (+) Transcript_12504:273-1112(+)